MSSQHLCRSRLPASLAGLAALLLAAVAGSATADTEVYQWRDSQGNLHYSDTPPGSDANRVVIRTSPTRPLSKSPQSGQTDSTPPPAPAKTEQNQATREEALAKQKLREENCRRATENQRKLETTRKIYDPLPDGERRYLDDSEISALKVQVQADVERWCGS